MWAVRAYLVAALAFLSFVPDAHGFRAFRGSYEPLLASQLSAATRPVPEAALHAMSQMRNREVPKAVSQRTDACRNRAKRLRKASRAAAATTEADVAKLLDSLVEAVDLPLIWMTYGLLTAALVNRQNEDAVTTMYKLLAAITEGVALYAFKENQRGPLKSWHVETFTENFCGVRTHESAAQDGRRVYDALSHVMVISPLMVLWDDVRSGAVVERREVDGKIQHGEEMKTSDGIMFMSRSLLTRIAGEEDITLVGWHPGCGENRWSEITDRLLVGCAVEGIDINPKSRATTFADVQNLLTDEALRKSMLKKLPENKESMFDMAVVLPVSMSCSFFGNLQYVTGGYYTNTHKLGQEIEEYKGDGSFLKRICAAGKFGMAKLLGPKDARTPFYKKLMVEAGYIVKKELELTVACKNLFGYGRRAFGHEAPTRFFETSRAGGKAMIDNKTLEEFSHITIMSRVIFYDPRMLPVFQFFASPCDTAYKGTKGSGSDVPSKLKAQAWENWLYALPAIAAVTDVLTARIVRKQTGEGEAARCFRHLAGSISGI